MLQLWEMEHAFECVLAEASDEIPSNALLRSVAAARKPNADRENSHLARFLLAFKDTTKEHVHALVGLHDIEQVSTVTQSLTPDTNYPPGGFCVFRPCCGLLVGRSTPFE